MTQKSYTMPSEQYFKEHPLEEMSTGMMLYTSATMPEMREYAIQTSDAIAQDGYLMPDNSAYIENLKSDTDLKKLLRMMRNFIPLEATTLMMDKLNAREEEVLPEIERILLKAFNPSTIENCTLFLAQCPSDCSHWIRENYHQVKDAYARSRLCVVLGLKGGLQDVPFFMEQVEYFRTRYPETDYEQAPLVALYHLKKENEK